MSKEFLFEQEARAKILNGVNILARSVGVTLGPKGRNVLIDKGHGSPHSTKDGVSVAREVYLEDNFENMGAQMVKEVASKTADIAGDGTTTATILAQFLINEGFKLVAAGHNPTDLKRGIDFAVKQVVEKLTELSKNVSSSTEIEQVGTISANGNVEIGKMIAEAMEKVGNDGIITLEDGKTLNTELTVVNGYQFDRGYLSQHFATNEKLESILEDALILVTDKNINNINVMLPMLEKTHQTFPGRPILFIADSVDGDALPTLILNHLKGALKSCVVKGPGYGNRKSEMLQDIAVLTGATLISEDLGNKLENFTTDWLGMAKKVVVTPNYTTIIEGQGDATTIEDRVAKIRSAIETAESNWDKEKQQERLAKLIGGAAVIAVGGATEAEMKSTKDLIDDALNATRAAVQEGIVPGGGVALLRASKVLDTLQVPENLKYGVDLIRKATKEPLKRIVDNAGIEPAEVILEVLKNSNVNWGYNAQTQTYEDLMAGGVLDPSKVVRVALQNAASVAGLAMTTSCMITNKKEDKKHTPK